MKSIRHHLILASWLLAVPSPAAFNCNGTEVRRAVRQYLDAVVELDSTLDRKKLDASSFCQEPSGLLASFVISSFLSERRSPTDYDLYWASGIYVRDALSGEFTQVSAPRLSVQRARCAEGATVPEVVSSGTPKVDGPDDECAGDLERLFTATTGAETQANVCDGRAHVRRFDEGSGPMLHAVCIGPTKTAKPQLGLLRGFFRCDRPTGKYRGSSFSTGTITCNALSGRTIGPRR